MKLREHIKNIRGFRHITDNLQLLSPVGRRTMLDTDMMSVADEIEESLERVASIVRLLETNEGVKLIGELSLRLMQLRDVAGTIVALRSQAVLTDIDLFEIKGIALLSEAIRSLLRNHKVRLPELPELNKVIQVLDPENKRLPHFYIYDAYSIELTQLRLLHKATPEGSEREEIWLQCATIEDKIRHRLSRELEPMGLALQEALEIIGLYDLTIAKAKLAILSKHNRPKINRTERVSIFRDLRHPEVESILRERGRTFQAIDIEVHPGTTLITGANMAGKTVLLRAIAIAQLMCQYGFFVAATQAEICPVDAVMLSVGDAQDETEGLSSFGAEMMQLSEICHQAATGKQMLILIDEPARTTNPAEGQAIVSGLVELLNEFANVSAILTTHYSDIEATARRLRVRGFVEERVSLPLRVNDLNTCIDYSLEETSPNDVPHEAIRIAEILGVYPDLIHKSSKYISHKNENK